MSETLIRSCFGNFNENCDAKCGCRIECFNNPLKDVSNMYPKLMAGNLTKEKLNSVYGKRVNEKIDKVFPDMYCLVWKLKNRENGEEYVEKHDNISLSDFETIYENNTNIILNVVLFKKW
jgi:hypothetical protein